MFKPKISTRLLMFVALGLLVRGSLAPGVHRLSEGSNISVDVVDFP